MKRLTFMLLIVALLFGGAATWSPAIGTADNPIVAHVDQLEQVQDVVEFCTNVCANSGNVCDGQIIGASCSVSNGNSGRCFNSSHCGCYCSKG